MNEMGEGHVDGSRNCAAATNLRAEGRVRSHLGLSKWHRDSIPSQCVCCLSLSDRSVCAQGQYDACCLPVSSLSVHRDSMCAACPCQFVLSVHRYSTTRAACPSVRCLCTGTLRVLSVHVSSFCLCTGTVCVLSVPVHCQCSTLIHSCTIGTA